MKQCFQNENKTISHDINEHYKNTVQKMNHTLRDNNKKFYISSAKFLQFLLNKISSVCKHICEFAHGTT